MFKFRIHTLDTIRKCYSLERLSIFDDHRVYLKGETSWPSIGSILSIAPEMLGRIFETPKIPSDREHFIVKDDGPGMPWRRWAVEDWMIDEILEEVDE